MPKFVIERNIPGAGDWTAEQMKEIAGSSNKVLGEMGSKIQWVQSYVSGDKVYCVYIAPDEETIREHGKRGQFPTNVISEVKTMIDPTTAE